jgi:hypothetical protein
VIARAFALIACAALWGCESVPQIDFETPEAGTDVGGDDANSTDAVTDAGEEDAGCPDAAATLTCCGTVLCFGPDCTLNVCGKCEGKCNGASQICCPRNTGQGQPDCPTFAVGCSGG